MSETTSGFVDESGNTVVEYSYDSWGKVLSITGSLKDTVGQQNSFRWIAAGTSDLTTTMGLFIPQIKMLADNWGVIQVFEWCLWTIQ